MRPPLVLSPWALVVVGLLGLATLGAWIYGQRTTPQEMAGLPYYVEAERLDPIFAVAGTNPKKLSVAVSHLISEQRQIAQLYSSKERAQIMQSLYPSSFLLRLPALESARVELLTEPSVPNAKRYHRLLIETIDAYRASAESLATTLEALKLPVSSVGYLGGNVTPKDFAMKMRRVAAVAAVQKDKENARFACLTAGTSTLCTPLDELRTAREAMLVAPPHISEPSNEIRKTDSLVSALLKLAPNYESLSTYMVAFPSNCLVEPITYARAFYAQNAAGEPGRKLGVINNAYFYDLLHDPAPRPPLVNEQLQAGATIQYQNMGNLYECPNAGLDALELGRILGVRDLIAQKSTKTAKEEELLAMDVLQKADLAPYISTQIQSNAPDAQELAERYLEGSANFDQIVMGAYSDNHFLINWDKSQYPVEFNFMMVVRNFASALFLLSNPTFVPEQVDFFTERRANPLLALVLREYRSDVSKVLSDDEIARQVGIANDIAAKYFNTGR